MWEVGVMLSVKLFPQVKRYECVVEEVGVLCSNSLGVKLTAPAFH